MVRPLATDLTNIASADVVDFPIPVYQVCVKQFAPHINVVCVTIGMISSCGFYVRYTYYTYTCYNSDTEGASSGYHH